MNSNQISNEISEKLLSNSKYYGTYIVGTILGIYGLSIIKNLVEKAIESNTQMSISFMGMDVNINNVSTVQ